jgi:hyperosmotically inducible periplasmic protein
VRRIGGDDVGNHSAVQRQPGQPSRDWLMEGDVNFRLADDPVLDATEVQVHASGGQVTLTGNVVSPDDWQRAENIAWSVSGVQYVMNNLRVRQPGTAGATG